MIWKEQIFKNEKLTLKYNYTVSICCFLFFLLFGGILQSILIENYK